MSLKFRKIPAFIFFFLFIFAHSASVDASDIYDYEPSFSPYYAGSVKSSVLYRTLEELNYIRRLVGVPDNVTLNAEYTRRAQHGAVLLDAVNNITHTPGKPYDMDNSFYELGYDAASHGNIANGYGITLSESTKLYMDDSDSYNINYVGHRRWLMNPRLKETGFGISTRRGYAVTYVIEEFNNDASYLERLRWPIPDEYITWPSGKHPHPLTYFEAHTAWSVTLNSDVFDTCRVGSVGVRLTRLSDGKIWNFGALGNNGFFNVADNSYAYDECVIFCPDDVISYRDGEIWRVEVSGLTRKDGAIGNISYTVQFTGALTGYENDNTYSYNDPYQYGYDYDYYNYDYYNYGRNNGRKKSGGGGCNSLPVTTGVLAVLLYFGIPRRK